MCRAARVGFHLQTQGDRRHGQTKPQDAIALLKDDHRKVEDLFAAVRESERRRAQAEARRADLPGTDESTRRSRKRFSIPRCEGKVDEDLLKEAYVEHDGAKVLIAEIEAGRTFATNFTTPR